MQEKQGARYFWGLDLVRFFAASMVVLFHTSSFGAQYGETETTSGPLSFLEPAGWFGWMGVPIFFVLSGFVISASAKSNSPREFIAKRAVRILPVLWLSALLSLAIHIAVEGYSGSLVMAFFKTIILSPKGPYIDGVVWTLVVEAVFYSLVALTIVFAHRLGGIDKALGKLATLLGIASTLFILTKIVISAPSLGFSPQTIEFMGRFFFKVMLLSHGVNFAAGIFLYRALTGANSRQENAVLALCICISGLSLTYPLSSASLVTGGVWIVSLASIYFGSKYGSRLISRDLRPVMRPIGLMTYPLYLNHFVLAQALLPAIAGAISSPPLIMLVLFGALLMNAWFIAMVAEPWCQAQFRRILQLQRSPREDTRAQLR